MTQEALKLALESMKRIDAWLIQRGYTGLMPQEKEVITAIKEALSKEKALQALHNENERLGLYKDAYAQPEQEPVAWKLMPRDATDSMLKAMDECSTEGYDERLYAGHAASVYMAAWDEAPTPPQRKQEFIKYEVENADDWSEWVCPDPKGYLMKCCDCGLVHETEFGVVRYKSETEREDCEPVEDPNLQAVFRMRRSEQWSPEDTAHRAGGLPMAQPEQEPVAWRTFDGEGGYDYRSYEDNESYADEWDKRNPNHKGWVDKLYTAAPQRPRVVFPTMLRKMWSGSEVQAWLDENVDKENT